MTALPKPTAAALPKPVAPAAKPAVAAPAAPKPTAPTTPKPTPAPAMKTVTPAPAAARPAAAAADASSALGAPAGKVKGSLVIARMKYLRARGVDDAERVLRRMSAADQQVLRGMLLPSSWYSADLVVRLEMTIVALLARGERSELFLDMGRFTADTNLGPNGVQRPYLNEEDPHYLLKNVPRMYSAQHSSGVRTYEQTGTKAAVIRTVDGDEPNAEDCLTAIGWLKRAIELSGGRIVTVEETQCRGRHGSCCEYVCRWA